MGIVFLSLNFYHPASGPVITNLTYDNITLSGVTVSWTTDIPSDSKIRWMASDSNYQAIVFTDSIYNSDTVTNHVITISNLQPANIYKYQITSQSTGGTALDSGYFVTQSASTGRVEVYFNHTVDTTVSTGENANGSQDFEARFLNRIDSAQHSIDAALFNFTDITSIAAAMINAKNRGVKVRCVCTGDLNTPMLDSLVAHGIPIIKRNYDTSYIMHNKFWIFDYRNNSDINKKFLWTGSTNISHPQFHTDKNNIIVVQDESLCAVYTREFEEMWGSNTDMPIPSRAKFGPLKINNVPHILNVAGVRMEVYFSPSDSVANNLCRIISANTTRSIFFCILHYAMAPIEDAMHNLFNNGKQIKGVFDLSCSSESGAAFPKMKGMPVTGSWKPPADVFVDSSSGLLHHKYLIIDANSPAGNKITVTGSYNWGREFSYENDENLLAVFNPGVNNLYYQEFYARFRGAGGEIIGIQNISSEMPSSFSLSQNYPNPFNPVTNLEFGISKLGFVSLKVYDILGKEVVTLVNEKLSPGKYKVEFDGSGLPSGVYFYRLTAGEFTDRKKMMVVK
ncbi:MAG: T9SS type A sorting domain-containing protein [Ignavibacteria bacterium]|nr:T9SS type A sorting domain-containing protein [Ignavibacteria bacterium]